MNLDLAVPKGLMLPLVFNAPSKRVIHSQEGKPWGTNTPLVHVSIRVALSPDGTNDRVVILRKDTGETMADYTGRLASLGKAGEPHPTFPGEAVASVFTMKDPYAIKTWTLRVFEGEAKVLRGDAAAENLASVSGERVFAGHRYKLMPDKLSWPDAKAKAEAMGGHLAAITTREEHDFIVREFASKTLQHATGIWLGASETASGSGWKWVTGEPFAFTAWGDPEPNQNKFDKDDTYPYALDLFRMTGTYTGEFGWNDTSINGIYWKKQNLGYLVEWDAPSAAKMPVAAAAPTSGAVNLLQGLAIGRDAISGGWSQRDGELSGKGSTQFDKLVFNAPVPEEYDFRVVFTRTSGDKAVTQHLVLPGGQDVMWIMGGFGNNVFALETVGGAMGNANATTSKMGLENGRRYESVVKVRRDRIQAELDGKLILDHKTAGGQFAVYDKWKYPDPKKLGVGCQQSTQFHQVELIPYTSKPVTASPVIAMPSPAVPPVTTPASTTPVPPPAAPTSSDPRLAQLEAGFKARYQADAQKPFLAALAALNQSYIANGIARARAAAQAKGALAEVTTLDAEKTRIQNNEPLPPADLETLPASLKLLRSTYRTAYVKIEAERVQKAAPLYDLYLGALDAYIAELTKANKIDDAQKVQALRDGIAEQKPKADAGMAPAQTGAATDTGMNRPGVKPAASEGEESALGRSRWYEAARWAISVGGYVRVDKGGRQFDVRSDADIPAGRFDILTVNIEGNGNPKAAGIRDDDFTRFSGLKELNRIRLRDIKVGDNAFTFLPTTPAITYLELANLSITDAVLVHMAPLRQVTDLTIESTRTFTGGGVEKLALLPMLKKATFNNTSFTDAAAKAMTVAKNLETLGLFGTPVTDEGIAGLGSFTKLSDINLSDCKKVRGTTLAAWGSMPALRNLELHGCPISPDVFPSIGKFVNLTDLNLSNMPTLNDETLSALAPLTKLINFSAIWTRVTGSGFTALRGCTELRALFLGNATPVSAAGLSTIAATFPKLEDLRLSETAQVGAGDLRCLVNLKALKVLDVPMPGLDDAGLAEIAHISSLEFLYSINNAVTAKGITELKSLKLLARLRLNNCKNINDAAVSAFKDLKALKDLEIRGSGITDAGAAELKKVLPQCKVNR